MLSGDFSASGIVCLIVWSSRTAKLKWADNSSSAFSGVSNEDWLLLIVMPHASGHTAKLASSAL